MNWFQHVRQDWIAETLHVFGFIRRQHLMRKFGISRPQASTDLKQFQKANTEAMEYDPSGKCYIAIKLRSNHEAR